MTNTANAAAAILESLLAQVNAGVDKNTIAQRLCAALGCAGAGDSVIVHTAEMLNTTKTSYRVIRNGVAVASGLSSAELMASDWPGDEEATIEESSTFVTMGA